MTIAVTANRFSVKPWPGIEWLEADWSKDWNEQHFILPGSGFLVYVGPNIELSCHPEQLVKFRQREHLGVIVEHPCIHTRRPDFPAPLGMEHFRNDFWVLRLGTKYATDFLEAWRESGNVNDAVWKLQVRPTIYPPAFAIVHVPEDAEAYVVWGIE